jgi:hypothetical protein
VRRAAAALFAALTLGAALTAPAQDSLPRGWRGQSFVGSTRIGLAASYEPNLLSSAPRASLFSGSLAVVPIVSDHWNVGVNPIVTRASQLGTYYQGTLAVVANYLLGSGEVSRPYVGGYLSETGATHSTGTAAWGAQAGWLHFLSPTIALRAEIRFRQYIGVPRNAAEDVFVTLDPYIRGRANQRIDRLPGLGVFDATVISDLQLRPGKVGQINGAIAPFLAQWLQVGGREMFAFEFDQNEGSHYLELFGRGYLPVDRRIVPFADLYTSTTQQTREVAPDHSHGERVGVRSYLTAGVAMDIAWEWRDYVATHSGIFVFAPHEERAMTVSLTTQFRAARIR